ncbi:MAG TPA: hypothetical protein VNF71_04870 [Acidimicrobiales bacterium]|nr:hypothetical protein [Acidimicrobiales bacterium]
MPVRVAIVGDYQPDHETHPATTAAVHHAGEYLDLAMEVSWIATDDADSLAALGDFDGVWIAPGSPYRSLDGALAAIGVAREHEIPLLGTCAGFQHVVIEFARRVLGEAGAHHAEYDPLAASLFITPLSCSLAGKTFEVALDAGSLTHEAYGKTRVSERYYCNFGLNPEKEPALAAAGLKITGRDQSGEARIIELAEHPFFVGTLFVPQVASSRETPHPLVTAFARSASTCSERRTNSDSNGHRSIAERWVTDDDLFAARRRFADRIPGFRPPVAYSVARMDDGHLSFGHVNGPTGEHRLPAAVLASFCGYTNRTGTFALSRDDFSCAVAALAPAEAATHWEHPNLWSWRRLLEQAGPESSFIALYLTNLDDPVADEHDAAFRSLLPVPEQNGSAAG